MAIVEWLIEYKTVIIFYLAIVLIVYFNRSKFDFQAKFIALYRMQFGIKLMQWSANKFGPIIRVWGYIGIFIGYAGMLLIVYFIFNGFYQLLFVPEAPPVLSPVIPGVKIPGSPIFVPFWYGITALFVVVLFHEFCHGIVSKAHGIKVKNTGIVFFGPLIGAFVEPSEKELKKKSWWVQQSMFAAGPVGNGVLAAIALAITLFLIFPTIVGIVNPEGFYFVEISEGYPALEAGVQAETIYTMVNGITVNNATYLDNLLSEITPGDEVIIANDELSHTIITTSHPEDSEKAYIGVLGLQSKYEAKEGISQWKLDLLTILSKFIQWIFILSLGIGLANLLPLGPVDGGRMLLLSMQKKLDEKKANLIFMRITSLFLTLIIILVIVPIIKGILP